VSAAAAGATGSEAAPPGYRGGRNRGGKGAAATTSLLGEVERAEHPGDLPAREPDSQPGRMDHHQLGTGRYQVVSSQPHPEPGRSPESLSRLYPRGRAAYYRYFGFFFPVDLCP
jgi:hypothetical protein